MERQGWTLIELLGLIAVIFAVVSTGQFVASSYGTWSGIGAGIAVGVFSATIVALFYRLSWRHTKHKLRELTERYDSIYRVVAVPDEPKIIGMPEGAEIKVGDYAWEAGPTRDDDLIYLHGLTPEWTVVWHAGLHPEQIERVAAKPYSQYDSWHPYWADPPPLPPCPFPVIERETLTIGRPHYSHSYFETATPYVLRGSQFKHTDPESV